MSETFSRQQVDAITAPWLNLCKEQEEQIAQLKAERDSLMNDMQRIYDNCSDTDLIIDIASAALEEK